MTPQPSWDIVADIQQMLSYPFMVNAVRAGAIIAVVGGVVGWMMVLRRESFAGHTLAVIGFPGAAAAAWLGLATGYGYFTACIASAAAIAVLTPRAGSGTMGGFTEESAVIGTVQAVALAMGLLFVSLYHGFLSGLTNLLFGTIAGVSDRQVIVLAGAGLACLVVYSPRSAARCSGRRSIRQPRRPAVSRCDWSRRCFLSSSVSRPRAQAKSPAACSCSRCWYRRPRPRSN